MADIGITIPNVPGQFLTAELSENAVKFVSMGCGDADACPMRLRSDMEDWDIPDPKNKEAAEVTVIREVVRARVKNLVEELLQERPEHATSPACCRRD